MSDKQNRKLAAILFADIVGYTSLMQADEAHTFQIIKRYQVILNSAAQQFNGQVLKNYGDGSLMTFSNSLDAVKAAKQIQEQAKLETPVPLRIGIHVGEFILEKGDIYGNGVNLASRIESLGITGTILFSKEVFQKIKNQPDFKAQSLGDFHFKNVEEPMEVFALANEGFPIPKREEMQGKIKTPNSTKSSSFDLKKWSLISLVIILLVLSGFYFYSNSISSKNLSSLNNNTLAVLPFKIQGSPELNYLGEGMTDLLSTKLDGIGNIRVVDPNAILGYLGKHGEIPRDPQSAKNVVMEFNATRFIIGSVTQLPGQIQFNASLYSADGDLLNKQTETTDKEENLVEVIDALSLKLVEGELKLDGPHAVREGNLGTKNLNVIKLFLEGEKYRRQFNLQQALQEYEKALEIEPSFVLANYQILNIKNYLPYAQLKQNWRDTLLKYEDQLPGKYQQLWEARKVAVKKNPEEYLIAIKALHKKFPEDVEVNYMFGRGLGAFNYLRGRPFSEALPYLEKALEYDENNVEIKYYLAFIYLTNEDTTKLRAILNEQDVFENISPLSGIQLLIEKDVLKREMLKEKIVNSSDFLPSAFLIYTLNNENLMQVMDLSIELGEMANGNPFQKMNLDAVKQWKLLCQGKYQDASQIKYIHPSLSVNIFHSLMGNPEIPIFQDQLDELKKSMKGGLPFYKQFPFTSENSFSEVQCILNLLSEDRDTFQFYFDKIQALGQNEDYKEYVQFFDHKIKAMQAYQIGDDELTLKHIDKAMSYGFPTADQANRSYEKPWLRFVKGSILMKQGKYQEALNIFENFVSQPGTFGWVPFCYLKRAEIYEELGQDKKAIKFYDKFLAMYKNCDEPFQKHVEFAETRRKLLFEKTL